jgi:hypothetical protein
LDSEVVNTTEEVIIDVKKARESQLYSVGLAISHASYDKSVMEERELEKARYLKLSPSSTKYNIIKRLEEK